MQTAVSSNSSSSRLPPGPTRGLRSTLKATGQLINTPIEVLAQWQREFGNTFTVKRLGLPTLVVTAEPELVGQIYGVRDPELFEAVLQPAADVLFGANSLLMIWGNRHQRERKLMTPPFHGEQMRAWAETMAECGRRAFSGKPELKIGDATKRTTLEVIVRVVFGVQGDARVADFIEKLETWVAAIDPAFLFMRVLQHDFFGLAPYAKYRKHSEAVNALLLQRIAEARRDKGKQSDVLSALLEARYDDGTAMEDEVVRDHLRTLLFGGNETTATILTWVLYFVQRDANVREKVMAEIESLGVSPDAEAFAKLPYLGAVIDETLRIRPVTTEISRVLRKPWELGPWRLPPGVAVCPAVSLLHFNPEFWPEPEQFKPERFLDKKPAPNTYIPWGGGSHRCLGATFARFEIAVVIGTLLREFEFDLIDKDVKWGRGRVALEAIGGVRTRVRPKPQAQVSQVG
jgi:cytochrome P450